MPRFDSMTYNELITTATNLDQMHSDLKEMVEQLNNLEDQQNTSVSLLTLI